MKNYCILVVLFILFIKTAVAQKDTAVYYLKESGALIGNKDSADFKLIILPPDPSVDKYASVVKAFYLDGKIKFVTGSMTDKFPLSLQGDFIEYYHNGNKKRIRHFNEGILTGGKTEFYDNGNLQLELNPTGNGDADKKQYYDDGKLQLEHHSTGNHFYNETEYYPDGKIKRKQLMDSLGHGGETTYYENGTIQKADVYGKKNGTKKTLAYFPNGKLYYSQEYSPGVSGMDIKYVECRDSTGKTLTQNGNGYWVEYNDDFTTKMKQGKVSHGLADSIWRVAYNAVEGEFDTYDKGRFVKSEIYEIKNKDLVAADEQVPEFPGGLNAFINFLAKNVRYPATAYESHIQGHVIVSFVVEKDGALTEVKAVSGIGGGCDEEAVRVIKLSPKWNPGIKNGKPVRVRYSVPINFTLSNQ